MKHKGRLKKWLLGSFIAALAVGMTVPVLAAIGSRTISVSNDKITLLVNGQAVTAKDKNGKFITPVFIDGIAYIPAESVGNALGLDYSWNSAAKELSLSSPSLSNTASEAGYIGLEQAKQIALQHAGVQAASARFFKSELDFDDGQVEYEIEFYSGNREYDYTIEPKTGRITEWDYEVEGYGIPPQTSGSATQGILSLEQAKALAKAKAPGATLYSCKLDRDDGKQIYEGELREGTKEYDFEIDAVTGAFLKWDIDIDD